MSEKKFKVGEVVVLLDSGPDGRVVRREIDTRATKEKAEREASAVAKERARVEGLSLKGSVSRARGQLASLDFAMSEGHEGSAHGALEACVRALVDAVEALAHREEAAASSVQRGIPEPVVHVPDGETAPTITLTAERLDQIQKSCEATYGGGHHGEKLEAFQHGMWTAFNVLRSSIGAKTPSSPSVPRVAAITNVAAALAAEEAAKAQPRKLTTKEMEAELRAAGWEGLEPYGWRSGPWDNWHATGAAWEQMRMWKSAQNGRVDHAPKASPDATVVAHDGSSRSADEELGPVELVPHPEPLATVGLSAPQPSPKPTGGAAIWDLVIADMKERDRVGRERYGTPLQAGNGRKALVDAYQEALDLVVYLRQELEEREACGEHTISDSEMVDKLVQAGWVIADGLWFQGQHGRAGYGSTKEAYDLMLGRHPAPSEQEMAAALLASGWWHVRREAGTVERWTDRTGKVAPLPLAEAYAAMLAEKAR